MLDERAVEDIGQRPRHRRAVAFDHDIEVAFGRLAAPGVAHEAAGDEGTRPLGGGHSCDFGEQRACGGRKRSIESRPHGHGVRRCRPRDGALAGDDDCRRPLAELTAHRELWSTGGDDRQRTSDVARRQLTEAETFGACEVVREDVIVRAAREDPSTTPAREPQRVGDADRRRDGDHFRVDDIASGDGNLWVRVRAPRHRRHHCVRHGRRVLWEAPPFCRRGPPDVAAPRII